jgi:ABC-type multidrug transport system fused ATPase/permease subunit
MLIFTCVKEEKEYEEDSDKCCFTSSQPPIPSSSSSQTLIKGMETILQDINKVFELPVSYNEKKKQLNESIVVDLELIETVNKTNTSVYEKIFKPTNVLGKNTTRILPLQYTTDTIFLKNTQEIIKECVCATNNEKLVDYDTDKINDILQTWNELRNDNGFIQKYMYVEYEQFKWLNTNKTFLQIMSVYSIFSPIMSFITPLIILLIPFFLIKLKGMDISFQVYGLVLYDIVSKHAIFKTFNEMKSVGNKTEEVVYFFLSAAFYCFSIYNNFMTCQKFYKNMQKIHEYLFKINHFIKHSIQKMTTFHDIIQKYKSHNEFKNVLKDKIYVLEQFHQEIQSISTFSMYNIKKIMEIGHILTLFYNIHENDILNKTILYAFGFEGYMNTISGFNKNISSGKMNSISFLSKKKRKNGKFIGMFYPDGDTNEPQNVNVNVKNDYSFNKNLILTGVNASGKTTTLKSVIINVLLSQQCGFGCFDKGSTLFPFDNIHCYLNILDTSDRFSLFQSECKKCKDILKNIENRVEENHLCIFDELFSGTNPEEANECSYAFLVYLSKYKNATFSLTTHFNKLAMKFKKNNAEDVSNKKMTSYYENDAIIHTYKMMNGINRVKGGVEVLRQLEFPKEILETIRNLNCSSSSQPETTTTKVSNNIYNISYWGLV